MKTVGALLGSMSGSMGGLTASRNRGGQYFRQRVIPIDPATSKQNAVRGYLASAVVAWTSVLTAAQRTAWATYAANTPRTGPLGNEVILTGQQAFIGAFVPRMQAAASVPADAPTLFNRGEPIAGLETINGSTVGEFGVDSTSASTQFNMMNNCDDDGDALLFIGPPVGPGVNFWKGPYQFAQAVAVIDASNTATFDGAMAAWPINDALVAGQRRPMRIIIAYDDGRTSEAFRAILPIVDDAI